MSVAQIERELETLSLDELRTIEIAARRQYMRRHPDVLSVEETQLFNVINKPLPGGEELKELRAKRREDSISEEELARLISFEYERESVWARKLKAVSELADLRGQDFEALYQQLGLTLRSES